jgi:hypothetical protein
MATRDDWAARPMAARLEACRCEREGMMAENAQRQHLGQSMAYQEDAFSLLADRYALDAPDAPAEDGDLTPYLLATAPSVPACYRRATSVEGMEATYWLTSEEWATEVDTRARALLAASRAGGGA